MLWILAIALLALGFGLEIWAGVILGWDRALELDDRPPDPALPDLVFAGPFRFVRHPQSLGLLLLLAGMAVALRSPVMYVLATAAAGLVIAMALRHDAELTQRFGEAYTRYRRIVPFLVPLPRFR